MSVQLGQNNSFPNYLEDYAASDSWNNFLYAPAQPEDILKNGFTEVGFFIKLIEIIKGAVGLENQTSSKALGERLIQVIDTLDNHHFQMDQKCLSTLMKIAKRAGVFENKNPEKNNSILSQKLIQLQAQMPAEINEPVPSPDLSIEDVNEEDSSSEEESSIGGEDDILELASFIEQKSSTLSSD